MRNFFAALGAVVFGAFLASCDLQPKITALPDTVGDFISSRYPAMLADPKTEPEIYNSAVSDYGVYASPELYGSSGMDDYVNYAAVDDYILKPEPETTANETEPVEPSVPAVKTETAPDAPVVKSEPKVESAAEPEPDDMLDIPEYKDDELHVPAHAAPGTVVVRRGDTLYSIARDNNTTIAELARVNNLKSPDTIKIGQVLKLKSEPEPVKIIEKPKADPKPALPEKKSEPIKQPETKPVIKPVEQKTVEKKTATDKTKDVRVPLKTITVARGDTLYSLSRRYEIPVNDLAVMNGLSAPFALNVGQKIRVPDLPEAKPAPAKTTTKSATSTNVKTEKPKADNSKTVKPVEKPATKQTTKPTQTKTETKKAEPKKTETKKPETKTTAKSQSVPARSSSKFTWPVRGTILSHYGAKTGGLYNDGINISAAAGATVVAAENGVVAYAGNEVRGMGNLIIIQHADGWMTVYAHLNSMAVRRGVRVSVGQKIGTVGQTGKVTKPQLHFEIRKGTKSYNPTNYLKK